MYPLGYFHPIANFTYTPINPTTQDAISFTDASIDPDGIIANWSWNFGDGNISYDQNATHQYADSGTYNVSLTVTDDYGSTNITLQHIFVYNSLTVYYIDVGQGDAILIQTPENNFVLIDAGKQSAASTVVNFLNNLSVNTLKAFIASHPDADHIGGADEVIENFDVLSIYHPGYEKDTIAYQEFIAAAQNESCPIYTDDDLNPGDFINISNITSCQILHIDKNASDSNDASIVLRVEFNLVSFLFTGDISSDVESELIQNQNVDVDILKVAHHGSKYSTSDEFLNESTPLLSVISVGSSNPYGHPTPETLTRLIAHNSSVYRTDLNGTITVTTFGTTWNVAAEKTMIPNEKPLANFTYYPSNPTILDTLQFTDASEDEDGTIELWHWEFGDGDTSTLQNPTHQYADDGTYTVILNVTDDDGAANETTQQIVVANIVPVANDDFYSVAENGTLYISAPGVLENDTDAEGDSLSASLISNVLNGVLTLFDNGSFEYTPTVGYNGTDSFTYKAFDGIDYSNEATVTIWVISNHPPYIPSNPLPSDGKTNVDINKILSWSGDDPDPGDTVTYDVYFGISNPPLKMRSNQSGTSYDPGTMSYNTKHYWKIIAWGNNGTSAEGPIWSFTTKKQSTPYNPPYNPPPTNKNPIADASTSETLGYINTPVIFDGSLSSDEDGSITNYTWNFGDETTGYGDVTMHAYVSPGEYIVMLTVTDNEGATDDDTITVIISKPNIPPTAPEVDGVSSGTQNTDYIYSAVSTDADNDTIQYLFDWGDGETTTTDFLPNGTATTQTHSWATAGEYTISVKAYDNETESGTTKYTVLIDVWLIDDEIKGYLVDEDGDGTYDLFDSSETGEKITVEKQDDGTYLIDTDGDGSWDHTFSMTEGLSVYKKEENGGTPGFGLILVVFTLVIVIFWKRKRK